LRKHGLLSITTFRVEASLLNPALEAVWLQSGFDNLHLIDGNLAPTSLVRTLDCFLKPEAQKLKDVLARQWQRLHEPPLGDPDSDLIWEAEQVAAEIHALAEQPDVKQFFERRLVRYGEELRVAAERVLAKRYRVAFAGIIAVGKSIGMSPGFVPLRILSMNIAARRNAAEKSIP